MHQKSSIRLHPISIPHLYVLSHMHMHFASVKACCVEMAESDNDEIVEQMYHYITKSEYPSVIGEHRKRGIRKKARRFVVKDGELYCIQGKTKHKVSFTIMGLSK